MEPVAASAGPPREPEPPVARAFALANPGAREEHGQIFATAYFAQLREYRLTHSDALCALSGALVALGCRGWKRGSFIDRNIPAHVRFSVDVWRMGAAKHVEKRQWNALGIAVWRALRAIENENPSRFVSLTSIEEGEIDQAQPVPARAQEPPEGFVGRLRYRILRFEAALSEAARPADGAVKPYLMPIEDVFEITGRGTIAPPDALLSKRPVPDREARDALLASHQSPRIIDLFYCTTRKLDGLPRLQNFGRERADTPSYGAARVSVPQDHKIGRLERPKGWTLSVRFWPENEDPERHFIVTQLGALDEEAFLSELRESPVRSALVFVHGFNTPFLDGLLRLAQIAWDAQFAGPRILFSWASAGGLTDYDYDRESAELARPHFARLIADLRDRSGIEKVHVIAHSMGNQVVLGGLEAFAGKYAARVDELICAAPDVDCGRFVQAVTELQPHVGGVTLYASSADKALIASKIKAKAQRAGDIENGEPLIVQGVQSIDVTAMGAELFGLNHNTFASNRSLIDDIALLVKAGLRPPNERLAQIRAQPEGALQPRFWRYAP
jgi:esterase/lipase superfamily enzyme